MPTGREPLVTVITAVRNGDATLEQCMQSVLRQSYSRIEYIVVDGDSSDGTLDLVRKYESSIAQWVSEPDRGMYHALNKGLALARGELVGMINADDFYLPSAIESVVLAYNDNGEGVYHGDLVVLDEARGRRWIRRPMAHPEAHYLQDMPVNHPSMFASASLYRRFGGFTPDYELSADYELVCRLLSNEVRFHYIAEPIAAFREGGRSGGYRTFMESRAIQVQYGRSRVSAGVACGLSIAKAGIAGCLPGGVLEGIRYLKGSRYRTYS